MGFSDGTFTRALTAAVGSRSPVMQSVRGGSGDATLQTIVFYSFFCPVFIYDIGQDVEWAKVVHDPKGRNAEEVERTRVERENGI